MEWFQNLKSIQIMVKEFFKLWLCWLFDLVILGVSLYLLHYDSSYVTNFIVPLLLSIFITCIFMHFEKLKKNFDWAERRVIVYRDILEIFSRMVITILRSFSREGNSINILQQPLFRGFLPNNEMQNVLEEINMFVQNRENINRQEYLNNNFGEQVDILSNQYNSIISEYCTDSTIKLFYLVLVTNFIKLNEDIIQLDNEIFGEIAQDNAYMQVSNIVDEIGVFYERMFMIVEREILK